MLTIKQVMRQVFSERGPDVRCDHRGGRVGGPHRGSVVESKRRGLQGIKLPRLVGRTEQREFTLDFVCSEACLILTRESLIGDSRKWLRGLRRLLKLSSISILNVTLENSGKKLTQHQDAILQRILNACASCKDIKSLSFSQPRYLPAATTLND